MTASNPKWLSGNYTPRENLAGDGVGPRNPSILFICTLAHVFYKQYVVYNCRSRVCQRALHGEVNHRGSMCSYGPCNKTKKSAVAVAGIDHDQPNNNTRVTGKCYHQHNRGDFSHRLDLTRRTRDVYTNTLTGQPQVARIIR